VALETGDPLYRFGAIRHGRGRAVVSAAVFKARVHGARRLEAVGLPDVE
jgi:hypothetical protein